MNILENLNWEAIDKVTLASLTESYESVLYYIKVGYDIEEDLKIADALELVIRYYARHDMANDIIETAQKNVDSKFSSKVYKDLIGKMGD